MPYAIVGIISLGLVITSIRTVVVERSHIRRKLVGVLLKRQQKRLDHLKKQFRRYSSKFVTPLIVDAMHL